MNDAIKQAARILLVDDHALFRESVARLLASEPEFEIVKHCESVEQALATLENMHIDLVLLDFDLGHCDGRYFMNLAKHRGFEGKVLVVTAGVNKEQASDLIRSGVSGIFMKHNSAASLIEGIRDILAGKVWFDRQLLQEIVETTSPRDEPKEKQLTQREREVLSLVFEGLANKEIADRIGVSESSVKATLQQLFSKTGVRTRSQLVRIALERYRNQL